MLAHIEHRDSGREEAPGTGGFGSSFHVPVMVREVEDHLVTDPSGVYVDATLGGGGHTSALLRSLAEDACVIGIDRDKEALDAARTRLSEDVASGRFRTVHANFAQLKRIVEEDAGPITGLLLDLGVSSHQIDSAQRGFSFQGQGPLDMRMDQAMGATAADIVNNWNEQDLKHLIYTYGEDRQAPRIARAIVDRRPINTTRELARVVESVVPSRKQTKTLARIFQALRIEVNREMDALEAVLVASKNVLVPGGRVVVISYHSLEDRRVKRYFKYGNFDNQPIRDLYGNLITPWKEIEMGPLRPSEEEIAQNPRARSARMRVAEFDPDSDRTPPSPAA